MGTPNQYFLLFMCSLSCHLPIPCQLRLKSLYTWSTNLKIFIFSQIMLIPGPLGPSGLVVTGGYPGIFLRAQLDCP
jgi:hypothetical protein